MTKIYKRLSDGFEVYDTLGRDVSWIIHTYGGEFAEVAPPAHTSKDDFAKRSEIAQNKAWLDMSDYRIIKKLEKLLPVDDADVIDRQNKRDRINELEAL